MTIVEITTATIVVSGGGSDGGVVVVEIITATIVVSGVATAAGLRDRVLELRERRVSKVERVAMISRRSRFHRFVLRYPRMKT